MKIVALLKKNRNKVATFVAALLVSVVLISSLEQSFEKELINQAKNTLLLSLKSPSTAEFIDEPTVKMGYMRGSTYCGSMKKFDQERSDDPLEYFYTVRMTVDATNSYGAIIREDFTCVLQSIGMSCNETESFNSYREMCRDGSFESLGLFDNE